jgi:hypothetical protein
VDGITSGFLLEQVAALYVYSATVAALDLETTIPRNYEKGASELIDEAHSHSTTQYYPAGVVLGSAAV